jgi:NAD(P)-dependent dehydrogenase (short-subunit alcohol dehydrogenase family)
MLTIFGSLAAIGAGWVFWPVPKLDQAKILEWGSETGKKTGNFPLRGKLAIVTGSTSGIGLSLASKLYGMGASVYIVGRSETKIANVIKGIREEHSSSPAKLIPGLLDTSSLKSVKQFADAFQANEKNGNLDFLVNNAGIHYMGSAGERDKCCSPDKFDTCFATNYLGHFLLTQLLLKNIEKCNGVIEHISSSYHFQSDGKMLMPGGGGEDPVAAQVPTTLRPKLLAYANSKLAQILHSNALQRRFEKERKKCRSVAICPGWVATGILPNNIVGNCVRACGFQPESGLISPLMGLLCKDVQGGNYISNSDCPIINWPFGLLPSFLRFVGFLRPLLVHILAINLLLFQRFFYGSHVVEPSLEARDENLQEAFYNWSEKAVANFL